MSYTVTDKLMLAAIVMQFIIVVIGGTFSAHAASVWLTNKREERRVIRDSNVERIQRRADTERTHWTELLKDRDGTIASQQARLVIMEQRLERMEDLLSVSEKERRRLMEEKA